MFQLTLTRFVLELTLLDYYCVRVAPSMLAAGALLWTLRYLQRGDWSIDLVYHTSYPEKQLVSIVYRITDLVQEFSLRRRDGNIFEKYASDEFFQVQ